MPCCSHPSASQQLSQDIVQPSFILSKTWDVYTEWLVNPTTLCRNVNPSPLRLSRFSPRFPFPYLSHPTTQFVIGILSLLLAHVGKVLHGREVGVHEPIDAVGQARLLGRVELARPGAAAAEEAAPRRGRGARGRDALLPADACEFVGFCFVLKEVGGMVSFCLFVLDWRVKGGRGVGGIEEGKEGCACTYGPGCGRGAPRWKRTGAARPCPCR